MKIIDKTPLLNEKGELGIVQRVQGMLKFGFNWPNELEAQKAIITFLDRQLEKGYTLIHNMTLGASGIVVPIILLGPSGIHVIQVTYLRGRYEAKGDTWNEESGNQYKPASINLIQRTSRMASAVLSFIERQGVKVPVKIEPVLIAGNPGLHVESIRPAIKVMMIDGIKSFVTGLSSGPPVLSAEAVHEFTERIINPRPPKKQTVASPTPGPRSAWEQETIPSREVSRARTIFNASEEAKPFNPTDFDFAMTDEEVSMPANAGSMPEAGSAKLASRSTPQGQRVLGMTPMQLAIVGALGLALLCVLAGFAYIISSAP